MCDRVEATTDALLTLGWSAFFSDQVADRPGLPARISMVHRSRMSAIGPAGPIRLALAHHTNTGDYAVGD